MLSIAVCLQHSHLLALSRLLCLVANTEKLTVL